MPERGPIHEAVDNIEAAFQAFGRAIRDGLHATRQDYTLAPPEPCEASGGAGEAQESSQ